MSVAASAVSPYQLLDRLLEPVKQSLSPEVARAIADLRMDAVTQAHLESLADKSTEGTLTPEERSEYAAYVTAIDIIGILQAQARAVLGERNGG